MAELPYKQPKFGGFQVPRYLGGSYVNTEPAPGGGGEGEAKEQPGMKLGAKFTESTMTRTFEKGVKPLFEGEPYRPSIEDRAAARDEAKKQAASEKPFKPPSGPHKTRGKGDYTGTFGKKYENIGGGLGTKLMKGEVHFEPPNIKTNPAKKGSYGQPWTTLSERKGGKGVVGEYSYQPDPFDAARKEAAEKARSLVPDKPFRPANYPRVGGGTVTPGVLFGKGNAWAAGPPEPDAAPPSEPVSSKPFVPSAYPKKGYNRTLDKFPVYIADPLELKLADERERKKKDKEAAPPKPFVPANIPKQQATVSILRRNLGR